MVMQRTILCRNGSLHDTAALGNSLWFGFGRPLAVFEDESILHLVLSVSIPRIKPEGQIVLSIRETGIYSGEIISFQYIEME